MGGEMQYFRPEDAKLSVGDCMPFYKDGVFHLYYLLDEGHHNHPIVGGWGGHQWAHASSGDLVNWTHHPLAIACDYTCEGSICTGSVFFHEGVYYAFYALRPWPKGGEFVCIAKSTDGVNFEKPKGVAFGPEKGFGGDFRDPFVFQTGDGVFHMLVTSREKGWPSGLDGCLVRYSSRDMETWKAQGPFLRVLSKHAPECPDLFEWNGWYYLLFGIGGATFYRMGRSQLGPWEKPVQDMLDGPMVRVMKTAAWKDGRRIAVGWVPSRKGDGGTEFAGQAVFRELVQNADGTLGTAGVREMERAEGAVCAAKFEALTKGVRMVGAEVSLRAGTSSELGVFRGVPGSYKFSAKVRVHEARGGFGVLLGTGGAAKRLLEILPGSGVVRLGEGEGVIGNAEEIRGAFDMEVVVTAGVVDVRIGKGRTVANCYPGEYSAEVFLFAGNARVNFENVRIVGV